MFLSKFVFLIAIWQFTMPLLIISPLDPEQIIEKGQFKKNDRIYIGLISEVSGFRLSILFYIELTGSSEKDFYRQVEVSIRALRRLDKESFMDGPPIHRILTHGDYGIVGTRGSFLDNNDDIKVIVKANEQSIGKKESGGIFGQGNLGEDVSNWRNLSWSNQWNYEDYWANWPLKVQDSRGLVLILLGSAIPDCEPRILVVLLELGVSWAEKYLWDYSFMLPRELGIDEG